MMNKNLKSAFTLAEILVSLTIIGVIAAITIPSLTADIDKKTMDTRRIALYSRLSQTIGAIGSLSDVGRYNDDGTEIDNWENNCAMTFILRKLSQGMKIENTCDSAHLANCGFRNQILRVDGTKINIPANFSALINNDELMNNNTVANTDAAAFITKNGESIAVYYNPNCMANTGGVGTYSQFVCANFIYDLNGPKGPNTFGQDVGVATALYASASDLVMPLPTRTTGTAHQNAASVACENIKASLPTRDELISLSINNNLLNNEALTGLHWSASLSSTSNAWLLDFTVNDMSTDSITQNHAYICNKKVVGDN